MIDRIASYIMHVRLIQKLFSSHDSDIIAMDRSNRLEVFLRKVFWKYAAHLQGNTHAEVWFQ